MENLEVKSSEAKEAARKRTKPTITRMSPELAGFMLVFDSLPRPCHIKKAEMGGIKKPWE